MLSRLRLFLDQWIISLQTYPLTHLIVLIMTVTWMIAIEQDYNSAIMDTLLKILATGALTLPLTLIQSDRNRYLPLGAVALGLGYWLLLPSQIEDIVYSQQLWIIGSIIIAWIIPSVVLAWNRKDSQDLTWSQFTHRWMSLAQGVIGGLILWGGIAASLASIEFLFDVTIHSNIYQHIGVISVLCVGTWIWLINLQSSNEHDSKMLPLDKGAVRRTGDYPRWMRIFGQYIFLPLCIIYGLILIAYGIKILATGTWPQGQLVYMVAGYVGFGLLTWFFLLPLERGNSWLSKSYRALFISFVVTSGLMIGALIIRVQQYGWTIDRGVVVALIAWIIIMGVGSLIWTSKKWIIGLASSVVVGALAIYSLPSMIFSHQLNKIQSLLTTAKSNTGDATVLYGSLDYLAQNYGTGWIGQVFDSTVINSASGSNNRNLAINVMSTINITGYQAGYDGYGNSPSYFGFNGTYIEDLDIKGYNHMYSIDQYQIQNISKYTVLDKNFTGVVISGSNLLFNIDGTTGNININDHVYQLANQNQNNNSNRPYLITGDNYKLILTNANGEQNNAGSKITGFGGYLLLK